jgi:phosphoenolpyruvate---glycerone phosphotransferase subunit DhaL
MNMTAINKDGIVLWIRAYAKVIAENRDYLTELDAAIGDGDHGANMDRGFRAVLAKLPTVADQDITTILKTTGMTLLSTVGGAAGPLYGTLFLQAAQACSNKSELTLADWTACLKAAVNGVVNRGKAALGDKTMLDALIPAVQALEDAQIANQSLLDALQLSAAASEKGMQATMPLVACKGRASYLGERSAGHVDPGATSSYLLLKTAASTLSAG